MTVLRPSALVLVLAFALSGCAVLGGGAGGKAFRTGQKAEAAGDLEAADQAYGEALAGDPNNSEYQSAKKKVRSDLAARHRDQAKSREQAQDYAGAAAAWGRAAEMEPDNTDYGVRRDLSSLKAKNLGPDEWFDGVNEVFKRYPGNTIVERTFAGARAQAYQHNVNLAEQYLVSGDGGRAYTHFERAKTIDPTTPGMRADSYGRAEALAKAEQGDLRMKAGDAVGAYELYQAAYARTPLPEIQKKMNQAKSQAAAILSKIESARQKAERGQYEDALRIYETIRGSAGVPASVESEIARLRELVASRDLEAGARAAEKGDLKAAHRSLSAAVRSGGFDKVTTDAAMAGLDAIRDGDPGNGMDQVDRANVGTGALYNTIKAFALASAEQVVEKARAISKRDQSKALQMLVDLAAFEAELPEIDDLRKDLRSGSFNDLMDDALRAAKAGNDVEAASNLAAALNSSAAPDTMRVPAQAGADALKEGRYADAEKSFATALQAAPKSRLSQRGIDIARLRRVDSEKKAVEALEKETNIEPALVTLEAALKIDPANSATRRGVEVLQARVRDDKRSATSLAAAIAGYGRLAQIPPKAKKALASGAELFANGDSAGAEQAFREAAAAAPGDEVAKLAVDHAKRRGLNKLQDDAKGGGPEAVAELIKRDPSSAEAKQALRDLLSRAEAEAGKQNEAEAARILGIAAAALKPAPGVKKALDKGEQALGQGKMAEAETGYGEALELEPANEVAKTGAAIAKKARLKALDSAMSQAKSGGTTEEARAALKTTLEKDPTSPEARKAFDELIGEAERQCAAGNDKQAAALLDTANVVSKPETVRAAIAKGNGLLAESRYPEALAAYKEVLVRGDSRVAKAGQGMVQKKRLEGLYQALAELEKGGDLERGSKAAQDLLAIDSADAKVASAVRATLIRAEKAAASADDIAAARELKAAADATGEASALASAIEAFAAGRHADAEAAFGKASSDVARRGAALSRGRRLGSLKAGLAGDGLAKAESIRALLAADPNNAEAKKAFAAILERAKKAGAAARYGEAAEAIEHADLASGAAEPLSEAIKVGTTHLAESRFADAEKAFLDAIEIGADSVVAKTGRDVAKAAREKDERESEKVLVGAGDPRPGAKRLAASRLVDPSSKVIARGIDALKKRAETLAKRGSDGDVAQALEAAGTLEQESSDGEKALSEAASAFAKADFESAERGYEAMADKSKVAALGRDLAHQKRIGVKKAELESARKEKDVLRTSQLVGEILALDPKDALAKSLEKTVKADVKGSRVDAARTQKAQGKLGPAYVYLKRALGMDPNDSAAKSELDDVTNKLKGKLDLVLLVPPIARDPKVPHTTCAGLDDPLRNELMTQASKEEHLGAYVLSPSWTEAVEKKDSRAPEVGGHLTLTIVACQIGAATGKSSIEWKIEAPPGGAGVASGKLDVELPAGLIPRDEQDGAGKNATKALVKRASKAIVDALSESRPKTSLWLLTLAESGMKDNDAVRTADAWARFDIASPRMTEPKRIEAVEQYLATAWK